MWQYVTKLNPIKNLKLWLKNRKDKSKLVIIIQTGIWMLVFLVLFTYPKTTAPLAVKEPTTQKIEKPTYVDPFKNMVVEAKAAYVYDIASDKVLYEKNADTPLPIASLTKIMTTIAALELTPPSTEVTISPTALQSEGDTGLYVQEKWSLKKLLTYALVVSSNDGVAAVADALNKPTLMDEMNNTAHALGLTSMNFINESGLDESTDTAGAVGSAKDIAILLGYASKKYPSIFDRTRYSTISISSEQDISHTGKNTDILAAHIPGLIAGKTGYSNLAGGNLAIIFDSAIEHPIAVVVLGSTYDGRFADVQKLVNAASSALAQE